MAWFPNELSYWVPTVLLAGLAFLCKNLIINRLTKSVQHEYDKKLEAFKSEMRAVEQKISANERKIEIVSSQAISEFSQRQRILYGRKADAAEKLWSSIGKLAFIQNVSHVLGLVDLEETSKNLTQKRTSVFIESLWSSVEPELNSGIMKCDDAEVARIYLPKTVLEQFDVYLGILGYYTLVLKKLHMGSKNFVETKTQTLVDLAKSALPEYDAYIDTHKEDCFFALLPILKSNIRMQLAALVADETYDVEAAKRGSDLFRVAGGNFSGQEFSVPDELLKTKSS